MRETISGPDTIPAHLLGSVARALNFADATPAPHHQPKEESVSGTPSAAKLEPAVAAPSAPDEERSETDPSAIRVVLRIRPLSEREKKDDSTSCVSRSDKSVRTVHIRPAHPLKHPVAVRNAGFATFKFAEIFDESSSQSTVFERTTLPMIEGLFQGQSAVVLAHGVTCSGKTWTIQGSDELPGILPRSLDVIVNSIAVAKGKGLLQDSTVSESVAQLTTGKTDVGGRRTRTRAGKHASKAKVHDSNYIEVNGDIEYKIFASYLEVYNEQCYDLFEKSPESRESHNQAASEHEYGSETTASGEQVTSIPMETRSEHHSRKRPTRKILRLKMNREREVYAEGITEIEISNCADIDRLLEFGQQNRTIAHTKANEVSSRSHAVFFITLKMTETIKQTSGHSAKRHNTAKLSIVDLAGSERTGRTNNSGEGIRQKETNNINSSLMNLGRCLQIMRHNQRIKKSDPSRKLKIVPFRQSRLTHLLQHCLEAGSAVMMANVSPTMNDSDETIQALRCAAIAQEVTIAPSKERAVLTDRTNLIESNFTRKTSSKKVPAIARRYAPRSLRSKDIANSKQTNCKGISKARTNDNSTLVAKQKRENALLTMELEDERCAHLECIRGKTQLEEEMDDLFRQNERLKDRLADSEARLCVVEREVREELAEGAELMLKRVQEAYEQELDTLRRENEELWSSRMGPADYQGRSRVSIVSDTERKEEAKIMAARLARRVSKAAFEGIRVSLGACEQGLDDQAGSSSEYESNVEDCIEEDDEEEYIEESD